MQSSLVLIGSVCTISKLVIVVAPKNSWGQLGASSDFLLPRSYFVNDQSMQFCLPEYSSFECSASCFGGHQRALLPTRWRPNHSWRSQLAFASRWSDPPERSSLHAWRQVLPCLAPSQIKGPNRWQLDTNWAGVYYLASREKQVNLVSKLDSPSSSD